AHILKTSYATFEVVSPLEPQLLRQRIFTFASLVTPSPQGAIASSRLVTSGLVGASKKIPNSNR
ncbi:MAG: hypothetical protein HC916_10495, partial [Coleofasciculaceae cyanobacterium SM2_1_6]|nr:hypothetical protein [Coleofasciculaceae cyanobacterium SM2_1_6]